MSSAALSAVLPALREYVDGKVAAGFYSSKEIVESAVEVFSDEADPDALLPVAERFTHEAVDAQLQAQVNWPSITDCDRLDEAFEDLNQSGIVARQDFTCCGTCGVAEMADEIEAEKAEGLRVRGYTFYHMQDTEGAVEGQGLYLNYGALEEGEAAALQIGEEIKEMLERHGLIVRWNRQWDTRIRVGLDWKRRFSCDEAA